MDTVHKFQGREQDAIILTSVDNVITDFVDEMCIRDRDMKEQAAIAEVLSAADREIELLQQDIEQEKQKKKEMCIRDRCWNRPWQYGYNRVTCL